MARSPFSPSFWRSPLRGPWLTSVLGVVLLGGITVLFVTGLVSYAAYNPDLSPVNDKTPDKGVLGFYLFSWPTDPHWLYRLNQGVHVTLGITLIPPSRTTPSTEVSQGPRSGLRQKEGEKGDRAMRRP